MTFSEYAVATLQDCTQALECAVSDGNTEWIETLATLCDDRELEMLAKDDPKAEQASKAAFELAKLCRAYSKLLQHQHVVHDSLDDFDIAFSSDCIPQWEARISSRTARFQTALFAL